MGIANFYRNLRYHLPVSTHDTMFKLNVLFFAKMLATKSESNNFEVFTTEHLRLD